MTTRDNRPDDVADLYADLNTRPPTDRAHMIQDIEGLIKIRENPVTFGDVKSIVEGIISDRLDMLRAELSQAPVMLNRMIHEQVHHQLRARPDFQTSRLAIEQWVPALGFWLISGFYEHDTPYAKIVADLQDGDPRRKTPTQRLEESRVAAASQREINERESAQRVMAVIDNMSTTQISEFLKVERAIKTGETMIAHGEDLAFIERSLSLTKSTAAQGDLESQSILDHGKVDTDACVNPGHNPNVR